MQVNRVLVGYSGRWVSRGDTCDPCDGRESLRSLNADMRDYAGLNHARSDLRAKTVFLGTEPIEQVTELGMATQIPQEAIPFVIGKARKSVDSRVAQPLDGVLVFAE